MRQQKPLLLLLLIGFILSGICGTAHAQNWSPNHSIGTVDGKYNFPYNQASSQLVQINPASYSGLTFTYQWESCDVPTGTFSSIAGAVNATYSPGPVTQTKYYKRKTIYTSTNFTYSNTIKIQVVSASWEDINYIREHDITKTGVTTWQAIDALPIGEKQQTTTYLDGLGRSLQQVSRETATPPSGTLWGDAVQFSQYDAMGREPKQYLPYTTTAQSGKYKTTPVTIQAQYYTTNYNETPAYTTLTFENSPLNRVTNVKEPGTVWAASAGTSAAFDVNTLAENVQIFIVDYVQGNAPVNKGAYPASNLYKSVTTDENGKKVVEYTDKSGRLILRKVQLDAVPSAAHTGWICTYSVYDEFGLLRYQLQPEAVKYLDANGWSFAGTNGTQVLNELCFQYDYDEKGRTIWKKAPGAAPLRMIYDGRDRVVFMQDGNQAAKPTDEWTATLYDELDRPVITTLYLTTKTVAQLQTDINNAVTYTTVSVTSPAQTADNLVVDIRQTSITRYAATSSIEFIPNGDGGFQSAVNDAFTAEIDAAATTPATTVTTVTYKNPISAANLANASINTIIKYQFYDNYSFSGMKPFDAAFDNTDAYATGTNVAAIATSKRTISFATGSRVRVLGTATFLTTTAYYDEKGRLIQTLEENIKDGKDITTLQYHFDGRLLSAHGKHTTAGSGYGNFSTLTKNIFDKIGRITSVQKRWGDNAFKAIAEYAYDDMGRLKTKRLDPGYTGSGKAELEALTYTYNIHNNITGINKDYALKKAGTYNKWGNFFGLYLGYDNRDAVFATAQLDGHVTGLLWNTQGDDAQRKYDYTYDAAGRLTSALFNERQTTADAWSRTKVDFSVTGYNGKIEYDLNGNLKAMLHKGVLPGSAAPVTVDDLRYTYASYSNKLLKVGDQGTLGANNGSFGDFKDGTNDTTDDYVYDANGNLVIDLNKNVKDLVGTSGIRYNHLDKPEEIRLVGKGTVKLVYDADGSKLQKIFTPEGGGTASTTTYINEFVYKGEELQYINFEEGRIRVMQPVAQSNGYDALTIAGNLELPGGKEGALDYLIRDYQENVRMILTEQVHTGSNQATMETARAGVEEPIFGQIGAGNEVASTRFAVSAIPGQGSGGGWQNSSIGSQVSRLGNLIGKKTGPNALLKVMAGDQVSSTTQYYYKNAVTNTSGSTLATTVVNALVQAILGSGATSAVTKGATSGISSGLNGSVPFKGVVAPDAANTTGTNAKAYLTVLFFDERFNFVQEGSQSLRVGASGGSNASLTLPSIKAPKNGYCYVYVSNESDEAVYFDNFQVAHNRGHIVEESHYYSYGLKIAAISSQKFADPNEGHVANKDGYNDKELIDEADLDWYDYGFRMYDAQIGRFPQLDPLTDYYPELTPYQYASNDPIANIDIDGLEGGSAVGGGARAFSYSYNTATNLFLPAASKVTSTTSKTGALLNLTKSAVLGTANLASSTCQGCHAREMLMQAKTAPSVQRQATFSQAWPSSSYAVPEKNDDFYLNQIKRDRIERASTRPGDAVPLVGPLIQGFRRAAAGDRGGSARSFLKFGVEVGTSALPFLKAVPVKGTSNPFKGKTFSQIDEMFKAKGFTTKGTDPLGGKGSYFNPKSGTRYWFDKGGMYKKGFEGPHIDIWYNGHPSFEKVKFFLDGSPKMYTNLK